MILDYLIIIKTFYKIRLIDYLVRMEPLCSGSKFSIEISSYEDDSDFYYWEEFCDI